MISVSTSSGATILNFQCIQSVTFSGAQGKVMEQGVLRSHSRVLSLGLDSQEEEVIDFVECDGGQFDTGS